MALKVFYEKLPIQERIEMIGAWTRPGWVNIVRMEIARIEKILQTLDDSNEEEFLKTYREARMELRFWQEVMQLITRAAQEMTQHA